MSRPLLSICIPTYNRAKYLPECLESIVSQLTDKELLEKVEIVIADNASTDDTTKIVESYQSRYSNIVYFRNDTNLGFDRSFVKLMAKARGKYCLSIGDDDAFFEGAIHEIVEMLKTSTTPFYGLNCWGYDAELKNPVLPHPNLTITDNIYNKSLSEYVHTIKRYTNLIGVFVGLSTQLYLREPWVNYKGKEEFLDTLAVYMYINLINFKDQPFTIIAKPFVKTRSSNIRWDVFAGLETIQGRIASTLQLATWIRDQFKLPISNTQFYIYFYTREYWFTFKEIVKRDLQKLGLGKLITLYRKFR